MKTIVISSQKGGSGKTTLTAALAVEAERAGDGPVCVIDTDQQGTLSQWHSRRAAERPERAEVAFKDLKATLPAIAAEGNAFCFIDTAPTVTDENKAIIDLADLVVVPVQPSPLDAWAIGDTVGIIKEKGRPFLFVMTKANSQAKVTAQTIAALSHHGAVSPTFIASRVAYATAMASGNTSPELAPSGLAADEIATIWREVKSKFPEFANLRIKKSGKVRKVAANA